MKKEKEKMKNEKWLPRFVCASLFLVFYFSFSAFSANAQEQQPSVSKQINQIKRDQQYIYEEATHESAAEAESMAFELLLQRVNEYISENGGLSKASNVLVKDVKQKAEVLSMMRGTMYRVFVYVAKKDIEGVSNATVINPSSGTTVTVSDNSNTIVDVQQTVVPAEENNAPSPKPEEKQAPKPVIDPMYNNSNNQANKQSGNLENPLGGWQKSAIDGMLDCNDIAAVRAKLNRLKAEYKVKRYGTADNCPSVDSSWWAIFDKDGKLVTILGPASPQRIDYKNMQYSSLSNYKGMDAIWFTLAK